MTPTQAARYLNISPPSVSRYMNALGLVHKTKEERQAMAFRLLEELQTHPPNVYTPKRRGGVMLPAPFPPPPKGCRYYIARKRALCGKRKARGSRNYCGDCLERVSPTVKL